ncbi:lysozyme [Alphaproteobacteria bacterium]|nr:lysozyme [Alphaproteobacteria bacterium]
MKTNQQTIALIKHFESGDGSQWYPQGRGVEAHLTAYLDEIADPPIWTIGYGHTGLSHNDGTVFQGRSISKQEAERLLLFDLKNFDRRVKRLVKVPLNENQFGALLSFDFNTGGLAGSTLLRLLNAGDYIGAANELDRWVHAGGKTISGLVRRRQYEKDLFLQPVPPRAKPLVGRTGQGTALATPAVILETCKSLAPQASESLISRLPDWSLGVLAITGVVGLGLILYARLDDNRKGYR